MTSSGLAHAPELDRSRLTLLPVQGRLHSVGDPWRQDVWPVRHRLSGDAYGSRGRCGRAAKQPDRFFLFHDQIKACFPSQSKHAGGQVKDTFSMTYGERLLQAMDKAGIDRKTLAARLGVSKAAVGQVILGSTKMFDAVNHTKACEVLGVSPAWLATGFESMTQGQSSSGLSLIAHPVTLDKLTVVPTISWEALVSLESLPEVFKLAAPDTSMAPKVPQGTMVELTRNLTPRPGDGVLVRDREGHHYLRVYREKRPGHWEAYAFNDAYSPLDSQADGLTVVAVLTAVAGRWA